MKNRKKKIAIIGTAGVPSRYGGFETLAHNLVLNLNERYEIHVYASKKNYKKGDRPSHWNNAKIHYLPISANGVSSIIYDILSLFHALFYANNVLILGVSGGIFVPFVRIFSKIKIVVNIDGLEWRRKKWGKWTKKFLKFSEFLAVKFSHADITDNEAIKRYTTLHYKTASHLIAYGADHVSKVKITKKDIKKYPFLAQTYAFKVARIEPENNVELILSAFSKTPNKKLVVVGNWSNSNYGKTLQKNYGKLNNLVLLDPIYNQHELDKLRSNCFVYIHGHSAGGTNPSLVEAMYLKLPILAFDVSYNRSSMQNEGAYYKNEKELIQLLNKLTYSDCQVMAERLEKIAKFKYTWTYISNRYAAIFESFEYVKIKPKLDRKTSAASYQSYLNAGYAHLDYNKLFFESPEKPIDHAITK